MKRIFSIIIELKNILSPKTRTRIAGLIFLLAALAIAETAVVGVMFPFINAMVNPEAIFAGGVMEKISHILGVSDTTKFLVVIACILGALYIFKCFFGILVIRRQTKVVYTEQSTLSDRLFEGVVAQNYSYHTKRDTDLVIRTLTNDLDYVFRSLEALLNLTSELLITLFIFVLLFAADPLLTLIAAVFVGGIVIFINLSLIRKIKWRGNIFSNAYRLKLRWLNQTMGAIKEIKAANREELFDERFSKAVKTQANAQRDFAVLQNVPRLISENISMGLFFLALSLLIIINQDRLSSFLPSLAMFALAMVRLMPSVNRISGYFSTVVYSLPALESIKKTIADTKGASMPNNPSSSPAHNRNKEKTMPLTDGIRLESVSFAFSDAKDEPLFENANLFIPANKSTAFVGTTGAGKTTMADIILGLYAPSTGIVTADGRDIHKEREWWAERVGYVPQFIYLCDDTVRVNVAFGYEESEIDDALVYECLKQAHLDEFVAGLKDGLDTKIGEQGVRLSGGQRQRIGIARALYNRPQFLVMDEATSALDYETENAVVEAISNLHGNVTILLIAHRLNTIKDCDAIYRIENGQISAEKLP